MGPEPATPDGPPLIIGGTSPAAFRRVAQHAAGWIAGGGGPEPLILFPCDPHPLQVDLLADAL